MTNPAVEIARDMRAMEPETRKAMRPALRRGGEMIARETAVRTSWSTRIPGSIRVEVSFRENREGVRVRMGNQDTPHVRPYENLGEPGSFRHPVYQTASREAWVAQAARPALFPAARENAATVTAYLREQMDAVGASLGFH